jgi:hypothetical protein
MNGLPGSVARLYNGWFGAPVLMCNKSGEWDSPVPDTTLGVPQYLDVAYGFHAAVTTGNRLPKSMWFGRENDQAIGVTHYQLPIRLDGLPGALICRLPDVRFADGMGYELYASEFPATRPVVFEILELIVEANRLLMPDSKPDLGDVGFEYACSAQGEWRNGG